MKKIEMEGKKFGLLTVLQEAITRKDKHNNLRYLCECDCGRFCEVIGDNLRRGKQISCGCYGKSIIGKRNKTHGMTETKIYGIYLAMKRRCYLKTGSNYFNYGARGIRICDRWLLGENGKSGFECFYEDMGDRPDGKTLNRKDNDGNYSPENCSWDNYFVQGNNKRNTVLLEYKGKSMTMREWSEELGINANTIKTRYYKGLKPEEILRK